MVLSRVWNPADVGSALFRGAAVAGEVSLLATVVAGSSQAALLLAILSCVDPLAPLSWGSAPAQIHRDWSVVIAWRGGAGIEPRLLAEVLLLALRLRVSLLLGPVYVRLVCWFGVDERVDQDS